MPDTDYNFDFSKLSLSPGDVIVAETKSHLTTEQRGRIRGRFRDVKALEGVEIILLSGGISLEVFPEDGMNELGWYRKESPCPSPPSS